jgi:GGDEF domain-containing protein
MDTAMTKTNPGETAGFDPAKIFELPISADPENVERFVPAHVRASRWWSETTEAEQVFVLQSIMYLQLTGISGAQLSRMKPAMFRMFLRDRTPSPSADTEPARVVSLAERRRPGNRELRERFERLRRDKGFSDFTREELLAVATHDELTGLPNRNAYQMAAPKPVVAFADLEGLKWINDNIGHDAGDALLRAAADIMSGIGLEVYRLGQAADEFVVLFDSRRAAYDALCVANERLKEWSYRTGGRKLRGFQLSYGLGDDLESAGRNLNEVKAGLQAHGRRAVRGQRPAGLRETKLVQYARSA